MGNTVAEVNDGGGIDKVNNFTRKRKLIQYALLMVRRGKFGVIIREEFACKWS